VRKGGRLALVLLLLAFYAVLAPFGYAAFALLSLWPAKDPVRRARKLQAIMRAAFKLMHMLMRRLQLLDFDPDRIEGTLPAGPAVLVANHPCLCDVTSAMASFEDVTTAVKPALYRRAWLRPLLQGARLFEGVGSDPLEAGQVIEDGVARLREGFRVLIFPEGTRSPERGLHRFGRTAFEIACRANLPVVPLVIACDPVWLTKETPFFPLPTQTPLMRVTALAPILPEEHGRSSRRLRDVVEMLVRNRLDASTRAAGGA
jgi:1-acyl-sn-glycerol-3-phosphate acyltransferase